MPIIGKVLVNIQKIIKERLKMSDRWIANKFGLFDFWYYDEEEFELSNGKLFLEELMVVVNQ